MGATQRMMLGLVALLAATGVGAQEMRIQFAEKVAISATAGHTEFDAYGRRFSLKLESNSRLLHSLAAAGKIKVGSDRLMRGQLDGVQGSWVRLAKVGDALEGAIWDGHELYVVTSKRQIAAKLTLPMQGAANQTVVYRLSDTIGGLPKNFCGVDTLLPSSKVGEGTGLDQYKAMVTELRAKAASIVANEQLDLSLVADSLFQSQRGASARDAMMGRLNTVDGIFDGQVGVLIVPTHVQLVSAVSDPFTTADPERLLDQVATYRGNTPASAAAGITHLITGKNLVGDTVGIAYLDALCDPSLGVSLSDSEYGDFYSALIMAHELGHNFGAQHDPSSGTCAGYVMAPELNSSMQFSQCSLTRMRTTIERERGACIKPLQYADLELQFPTSPIGNVAQNEFSFPVTVRSVGTIPSKNATLRVILPPQISYVSAALPVGSCAVNQGTVTCQLGDLPAGGQITVDLRLTSSVTGTYFISGDLAGDNEFLLDNNVQQVPVGVQSAVDLGVSVSVASPSVFVNDMVEVMIDVSSTRSQPARGGTLTAFLGVLVESISAGAHSCVISPAGSSRIECALADVPSGTTTRITVRGRAMDPGVREASARVTAPNDGDYTNNDARALYAVRQEREIETEVSAENVRAVLGVDYELVYTLTSVGRLPADNVTFTTFNYTGIIQSIESDDTTCTPTPFDPGFFCEFGTLAPEEVRTITIRFRTTQVNSYAIVGSTSYSNGSFTANSAKYTWIYANYLVDVAINMNFGYSALLEGRSYPGGFEVRSEGVDHAQNVVATFDVPAPIRLSNLQIHYNPHGLSCDIVSPQRLRCAGSFNQALQDGPVIRGQFEFRSDTPMAGNARMEVSADGDGNPANDSYELPIEIVPNIDVGLSSSGAMVYLLTGQLTPVAMNLTTGPRAVSGIQIKARGYAPNFAVEGMTINGVDCPLVDSGQGQFGEKVCNVGDVPANANQPVVVLYRAFEGGVSATIYIDASASGDRNFGNDHVSQYIWVLGAADIQLSVAQTSATATNGSSLRYPLVSVTNTALIGVDVTVDIPLPPFATLASVSSSGICTGTVVLRCSFGGIASGMTVTADIRLNTTAVGTFDSNVTMTASFDSTPSNNAASVALSVTEAPPPPPPPPPSGGSSSSSGGGKKGGGSLEWLALAFLGLLVAQQIRVAHERHVRPVRRP